MDDVKRRPTILLIVVASVIGCILWGVATVAFDLDGKIPGL